MKEQRVEKCVCSKHRDQGLETIRTCTCKVMSAFMRRTWRAQKHFERPERRRRIARANKHKG